MEMSLEALGFIMVAFFAGIVHGYFLAKTLDSDCKYMNKKNKRITELQKLVSKYRIELYGRMED